MVSSRLQCDAFWSFAYANASRACPLFPPCLRQCASAEIFRAGLGKVDDVDASALATLVALDRESALLQALFEGRIGLLGPHGEDAVRAQRGLCPSQSLAAVERMPVAVRHAVRTFVEVEKDGIVAAGASFRDDSRDIGHDHLHPLVADGELGQGPERSAVPVDDF